VELLTRHRVDMLVDVRRHPGSRAQPQFNVEPLRAPLAHAGIGYAWLEALGGRRKARPDSHNTRWRNASFRGYADYMETPVFAAAFDELVSLADTRRCTLMCAEALWWRCHRSLIADALQVGGRAVAHIGSNGTLVAHPYTAAAWIDHGRLRYDGDPEQPLDM
jgi:uncharacterized protein (DUF488 family)